ncbi:hypothetical protein E4631_03255 [Hymenobacter sp. UV11]|uniref:hypothetical protein n=1 Tax=Hymenobacter sp. UV11 TaxID=1849735 RepID=UPI00107632CA|nr:hypothetical protein [Hymenobacter sp. UV11]TFZ68024.1 hypothetical protein E4631_03255 [Hymenobacter sp. UV11]
MLVKSIFAAFFLFCLGLAKAPEATAQRVVVVQPRPRTVVVRPRRRRRVVVVHPQPRRTVIVRGGRRY